MFKRIFNGIKKLFTSSPYAKPPIESRSTSYDVPPENQMVRPRKSRKIKRRGYDYTLRY